MLAIKYYFLQIAIKKESSVRFVSSLLLLVGRVCLALVFFFAALGKIFAYDAHIQLIAAKGISMAPLFLIGSFVVELVGSISLIVGYRVRFGALLLLLFLVPTTLIFHNFWDYPAGVEKELQLVAFLKNVAIFGGLLYVLTVGAGTCSCDHACREREEL